ncbi:MAG: rod shape-determining protein RodA [Chitinophagales bacterium]
MREKKSIMQNIDQLALGLYLGIMLIGLLTVYAVSYDPDVSSFFDLSLPHGKQMIFMAISLVAGFSILTFESTFFTKFAAPIYILVILVLLITYVVADEINGARSWLQVGGFQFQPAEFGKTATALMLAKVLSNFVGKPRTFGRKMIAYMVFGLPMLIIIMQNDLGSALVYASLVVVMYREGFSINEVVVVVLIGLAFVLSLLFDHIIILYVLSAGIFIWYIFSSTRLIRKDRIPGMLFLILLFAGLALLIFGLVNENFRLIASLAGLLSMVVAFFFLRKNKYRPAAGPVILYVLLGAFITYGSDYIMHHVLADYQAQRVLVTLGKEDDIEIKGDPTYNVTQSIMTIGSGGFAGKGYLHGTLTQSEQVPEQDTDFIFLSDREEFGFLGTAVFLAIYLVFILRVLYIAERQRSPFSRAYAYCIASIFTLQIAINVGMTIGLVPVIGIPLPFISNGGSSVIAFSIMVFIMLRLDADRLLILR